MFQILPDSGSGLTTINIKHIPSLFSFGEVANFQIIIWSIISDFLVPNLWTIYLGIQKMLVAKINNKLHIFVKCKI